MTPIQSISNTSLPPNEVPQTQEIGNRLRDKAMAVANSALQSAKVFYSKMTAETIAPPTSASLEDLSSLVNSGRLNAWDMSFDSLKLPIETFSSYEAPSDEAFEALEEAMETASDIVDARWSFSSSPPSLAAQLMNKVKSYFPATGLGSSPFIYDETGQLFTVSTNIAPPSVPDKTWNTSNFEGNWILDKITVPKVIADNVNWLLPATSEPTPHSSHLPVATVREFINGDYWEERVPGTPFPTYQGIGITGWIAQKVGSCTRGVLIGAAKHALRLGWQGAKGFAGPNWSSAADKTSEAFEKIPSEYRIPAVACGIFAAIGVYSYFKQPTKPLVQDDGLEEQVPTQASMIEHHLQSLEAQFHQERQQLQRQMHELQERERQMNDSRIKELQKKLEEKEQTAKPAPQQFPSAITINLNTYTDGKCVKSETVEEPIKDLAPPAKDYFRESKEVEHLRQETNNG